MPDAMRFGEQLRRSRKDAGLRQSDVASKIGTSQQAIAKWEAGDTSPDADYIPALARFMDLTVDEVLVLIHLPDLHGPSTDQRLKAMAVQVRALDRAVRNLTSVVEDLAAQVPPPAAPPKRTAVRSRRRAG